MVVVDEQRQVKYRSLASELVQDRIRRQSLAEEMRVLYVAMTRAREHLVLLGTCDLALPQRWQQMWGGHDGPLPPDAVLGGRCVLDWVGPAVASIGQREPVAFELHTHEESEIDELARHVVRQPALSETQVQFAQLQALKSPPAHDPAATRAIDRLVRPYAHEPYTRIPAVNSVTSLTKTGRAAPTAADPATRAIIARFDQHLPLPKTVATDRTVSPLDVGAATHRALQYLDFASPAAADAVRQQLEQLVARKLLAEAERAVVDIDAVVWLMTSELGAMLKNAGGAARRELSLQFPAPPDLAAATAPQEQGLDRVMIRGRIDVLVPAEGGLVVADYKTDAVSEETVTARVELYRPQIVAYCDAIHRISGQPIRAAYLAFLSLRRLQRLTI
jgi:ATP-dependent helicase/nuclease subunit A